MVLLVLFVLVVLSCGGGGLRSDLVLRFSGQVEAPYFSEVRVRVSGEEFEPVEVSRRGVFYPGDRVTFELELPEGRGRLVEALVYDPQGNPVYYGSVVVDFPAEGDIVVSLRPTEALLLSSELFAKGSVPVGGAGFYLLSEDLYSVNLQGSTSEEGSARSFLAGGYLAYERSKGEFEFLYLREASDLELVLERSYTFAISLPPGEEFLILSGSYEGLVRDGESITVSSAELLLGPSVLLGALGQQALYLTLSSQDPVEFLQRGCFEGDPNCLPLNLSFEGLSPEGLEVLGEREGILLRMDAGDRFWKREDLTYHLRLFGSFLSENGCRGEWEVLVPLGEDFGGEASLSFWLSSLRLSLSAPAQVRVRSGETEVRALCPEGEDVTLEVPYLLGGEASVEVLFPDGRYVGGIVSLEKEVPFAPPEGGIKEVKFEEREGYLFLSLRKTENLSHCSLKLGSPEVKLSIGYLPPWREYLKIRKLWEGEVKGPWRLDIRCYEKEGRFFFGLLLPPEEEVVAFEELLYGLR